MVESEILPENVLVLRPSASITAEDIARVREQVDPFLEGGGKLAGVMIEAESFPGWKDFAGFADHLRFIRDHHHDIPRVAFVSDSHFLTALPRLARHFISAEFQHFDADERKEALAWITGPPTEETTAIRRGWFPDRKLIWIYTHGRVHTDAYKELAGWMDGILAEHGPVSFLVDVEDMDGIDAGAILADFKFGVAHRNDIHRVALVGDEEWTEHLADLPNPFGVEVKAFKEAEEWEAWDWATGK